MGFRCLSHKEVKQCCDATMLNCSQGCRIAFQGNRGELGERGTQSSGGESHERGTLPCSAIIIIFVNMSSINK